MKFFTPTRLLLASGLSFLACASLAQAQFTNGQAATLVWGQSNFTTGTAAATSLGSLTAPNAVAVDPTTGKFFVADTTNNRVLRYSSSAAAFNGAGAETVFGQLNFTGNTAGTTQITMSAPRALAFSSNGTLWVADTGNNRVLEFAAASSAVNDGTEGIEADLVLGQAYPSGVDNFETGVAGTTQGGMNAPTGLAIDGSGSLYVVDTNNNRVLKFANPAANTNGLASGLFGQTNFNAGGASTTSSTFSGPTAATVDASGNLWVADTANNRVLKFTSIASKSVTGSAAANLVLGQADFVTSNFATSATGLNLPRGVTFDPLGRIYVSDFANNRVVIFSAPATNGASASFVLGQADFVTGAAGAVAANTLSGPRGLIYTNELLLVADSTNNRVLGYDLTPGTPSFIAPSSVTLRNTKKKTSYNFTFAGSNASDSYLLGATVSNASKVATVKFFYLGQDITSALTSNTYSTGIFGPGQLVISVQVTPKNNKTVKTKGGKFNLSFTAVSQTDSSKSAQQATKVTLKPKK